MVKNSIWKNGPKFLNEPIDQWPLRQDCNLGNDELPDTIGIVMLSDIKKMTNTMSGLDFEDVKLENISSYSKLFMSNMHTDAYRHYEIIQRQKWHVSKRNLQVLDLVLVQDNNSFRSNWKLGQIVEAKSSRDGVTRDVTVRYRNIGPGTKYTELRTY
ncbi:unnamed protein product [Mytilus coruscus]|uniref:DUF5641 domain-containing protein n=1 Tax=Mytilus coruscus TaxID=42192 RepID=A0A6J8A6V6_MYTCO|nr:unnamed protein product [Mytilus coruscus]